MFDSQSVNPSDPHYTEGDWIRFYRDMKLVIAPIEYLEKGMAYTMYGAVETKYILESRTRRNDQ